MDKILLNKYLSKQPIRIRIMYYIWIIQIKEIDRNCFKRINPYNPFGYILVFILIIMTGINEIIKSLPDMKELFEYN